jgi:type IV pilus assembly protein PilY1
MVAAIAALSANGQTPLGAASYDVQDYFQGEWVVGGVTQPSPIQYHCQKNFFLLVTDGLPNPEDDSVIRNAATSLRTTDHAAGLTGTQNVITHTIGFDIAAGASLLTQVATNGGGRFFDAANSEELKNSLQAALSEIITASYAFTAPIIPTTSVGGGPRAYYASFQPDAARPFWQGSLAAYTRNAAGLIPVDANGIPDPAARAWDAGTMLAAKAPASRTLFTVVAGAHQNFVKTNATITPALVGLTTTTDRDRLVDFLRGVDSYDDDGDGDKTESRGWKLGDIYHSTPVVVGPPATPSTDPTYAAFRAARATRTRVLLVGANDGMLHAFRESDGDELWAFIPPDLLGKLKELRPIVATHPYFVDGNPVVTDIKVGATWKTIVVFGERSGGTRYHALDVTDTTAPTYLWSFSDARLGETWSEPAIGRVKMADGTTRTLAFVGGGYDSVNNNAKGKAVFAIDLATGQKIWEYVAGSGDSAYLNFSVAAAPVAADLDGNGFLDRVYVGDVGGQLWKFDISAAATLSGSLVNNWAGKRFFVAASAQANPPAAGPYLPAQGIFERPALAYDGQGHLWVFIGTGDRDHPNATSSNRFYGIKDDTTMAPSSHLVEADLVDASHTQTTIDQGWYLPLQAREKSLASPVVYDDVVYFSTYTSNAAATCTNPSGVAKSYAVQLERGDAAIDWSTGAGLTGENASAPSESIGGGIPSTPQVVQGSPNDSFLVGTTDGQIENDERPSAVRKHLRYWKETY